MRPLIICGYDGSGKSTLARELGAYYNCPVFHAGPPPRDDVHAMVCTKRQYEAISRGMCIWDRVTPISRQCYQYDISEGHKWELNNYLHNMLIKAILVYCVGEPTTHKLKDYDTAEHTAYLSENEVRIRSMYEHLMDAVGKHYPVVRYDFHRHDADYVLDRIAFVTYGAKL